MHALSRTLDVGTEWSLAVSLQTMSACALDGLTVRRTRAVIEHLRFVCASKTISDELRLTCMRLAGQWRTIG